MNLLIGSLGNYRCKKKPTGCVLYLGEWLSSLPLLTSKPWCHPNAFSSSHPSHLSHQPVKSTLKIHLDSKHPHHLRRSHLVPCHSHSELGYWDRLLESFPNTTHNHLSDPFKICANSFHSYSTHSERNVNPHEGWLAPADRASVVSLSSSLPLYTSVPSSGCFLYLEPTKHASSGPLKWLHPLPVYFSPDTLEAHCLFIFSFLFFFEPLLQCQLTNEDFLNILHKIVPFLSTIVILFPFTLFSISAYHHLTYILFIHFLCLPQ